LGFYLGLEGPFDFTLFFWMLIGTGLVGGSSAAFNQAMERDIDALMDRTKNRPLPSGRLTQKQAVVFGAITGVLGEMILLFFVNPMTAVLGAFILFFYLGIYTQSKRVSPASTLIGAIPGAIPPLMGWTAARGVLTGDGYFLFAILFAWQIPHFFAIGWMYRAQYAKAHMPIWPVRNPIMAVSQALIGAMLLIPASILPTYLGVTGDIYFYGAIVLGVLFLSSVVTLFFQRTDLAAKRVFQSSLIYLPLLAILMIWDKT